MDINEYFTDIENQISGSTNKKTVEYLVKLVDKEIAKYNYNFIKPELKRKVKKRYLKFKKFVVEKLKKIKK